MRKIIFNKKFLAIVGICLSVAGGFAIKQKITTKASDHSFEVNGMNVSIQQCEGKSEEIMEEDLDETISNEVMALEEKGHQVIEILVGKSKSRQLPDFFLQRAKAPVDTFWSPNFLPSKKNQHIGLTRSMAYNFMKSSDYLQSIQQLYQHIQWSGADLVVNFYEILTGLTYAFLRYALDINTCSCIPSIAFPITTLLRAGSCWHSHAPLVGEQHISWRFRFERCPTVISSISP